MLDRIIRWVVYSLLFICIGICVLWFLGNTYLSPSFQYGMREQQKYQTIENFKKLSTDEIITQIDINKDWRKHSWYKRGSESIKLEAAISILASRNDTKAMSKIQEVIFTFPEGQKCAAASSIAKNNNKAMIPILCEALKRHTLTHTDDIIVKALIKMDDPSALECFAQEKDKILNKKVRGMAEKAIEKWSNAKQ